MLNMYTNDVDWVIANSPEDAKKVCAEHIGCSVDDLSDDDEWDELPADGSLKVTDADEPGSPSETLKNSEWIQRMGRSFVASTEY